MEGGKLIGKKSSYMHLPSFFLFVITSSGKSFSKN